MPRGGYRENAGKKTTWQSGCKFEDTKPIRVPKVIANRVKQVAHQIDAGSDPITEIDNLKDSNQQLLNENQALRDQLRELEQQNNNLSFQIEQLDQELSKIKSENQSQLSLSFNQSSIEDLKIKSKELLYDESLVRSKDRSPVKKLLCALFEVDKEFYNLKKK